MEVNINFKWFDFKPDDMDIHFEHVMKQISEGYASGELNHEEEKDDESISSSGWWKLTTNEKKVK